MSRVRIVTDSTVRFTTPGFLARHPVTIAPLTVRCHLDAWEESPEDEIDTVRGLFERCQGFPLAEPPSTDRIAEAYGQLALETDEIVSIHASAHINPTVSNALAASQKFLGRCSIQVIDSQTLSSGLGLLVEAAVHAAEDGADVDEVVRIVRGMVPRLYLVVFVADLTYLERSGLVTRSQALLGNMLGILPFLTMEDGKLVPMEKVRSRPRALEKVVEFVSEFSDLDHLVLFQGQPDSGEESRLIVERLRSLHPATPITVSTFGPSVASYLGPDTTGIIALEREGSHR
jgi:DegV family protein with EDD domain